jgi:hypothetical protein
MSHSELPLYHGISMIVAVNHRLESTLHPGWLREYITDHISSVLKVMLQNYTCILEGGGGGLTLNEAVLECEMFTEYSREQFEQL